MASRGAATWAPASFSVKPGATQFTVTPDGARSTASARDSASSPALAAADTGKVMMPRPNACATKDDTPIMRPAVPALISHGLAAVARSKKAAVIAARLASRAARSTSPIGRRSAKPALLTTTSRRPNFLVVSSTSRAPVPVTARSPSTRSVSAPAALASEATFSRPLRFLRAWRTSAVWGAATARAVAAPMPEEAPVMRMTRMPAL